jgi:hypothetical protein
MDDSNQSGSIYVGQLMSQELGMTIGKWDEYVRDKEDVVIN